MALLLAEERFLKIKQAMEEEHNQPEVLQELLLKLINDLQILKGIQQEKKKPTAQSSIPYCNSSMIDDEEARDNFFEGRVHHLKEGNIVRFSTSMMTMMSNTVIMEKPRSAHNPDEPIEEPDNSLSMGDEHLSTILETELDEVIKFSVEILVPIPSELEGISDDTFSEFESFHFDPSFPRPPPEPPDVEICLHLEPDAPVIDNFNELNDDQRGSEIDFSQNARR
ncbi:hypothetical protein Tco_1183413 [Tanacetum coccineum]